MCRQKEAVWVRTVKGAQIPGLQLYHCSQVRKKLTPSNEEGIQNFQQHTKFTLSAITNIEQESFSLSRQYSKEVWFMHLTSFIQQCVENQYV